VLVESNVVVDFPGAGIATEDGYEVRNVFRKNFVAYIQSTPPALDSRQNILINRPGSDGSGYWFRGVMNYFEGNEAWNCYRSGINLFNQDQPAGSYPSVPGAMMDTPFDRRVALPLSFTGNVVAANNGGIEVWGIKRFPYTNLTAAYNWDRQVFAVSSDGIAFELRDSQVVCEEGKGGFEQTGGMGIHSGDGYVNTFDVTNTDVVGCRQGIVSGGSVNGINMTGGVLQNEVDIDRVHSHLLLDGVEFRPLGTLPKRYIEMGTGDGRPGAVWDGVGPLPNIGFPRSTFNRGSDLIVKNNKGFGTGRELSPVFQSVARRSPGMVFVVCRVARLQPAGQGLDLATGVGPARDGLPRWCRRSDTGADT
jgi:hypothetical protein